jgi:hypothetical protein
MRPDTINSRMAAQRNHSLTRRWTSGSGVRRRSGRGGKNRPWTSAHYALLPLAPFQPDQKTIAQHHHNGVPMKTIPASFSLLHDTAPPSGYDGHTRPAQPGGIRGEITPVVFPVPVLAPAGALPHQPAYMAGAIAIDPPAAQRHKLGAPPPLGPAAPGDRVPDWPRLRRQHGSGPPHRALRPAPPRYAEISPHRHHMALPALLQPVKEVGIIPVISITGHTCVPHPTGLGSSSSARAISALVSNTTPAGTCACRRRSPSAAYACGKYSRVATGHAQVRSA